MIQTSVQFQLFQQEEKLTFEIHFVDRQGKVKVGSHVLTINTWAPQAPALSSFLQIPIDKWLRKPIASHQVPQMFSQQN